MIENKCFLNTLELWNNPPFPNPDICLREKIKSPHCTPFSWAREIKGQEFKTSLLPTLSIQAINSPLSSWERPVARRVIISIFPLPHLPPLLRTACLLSYPGCRYLHPIAMLHYHYPLQGRWQKVGPLIFWLLWPLLPRSTNKLYRPLLLLRAQYRSSLSPPLSPALVPC